MEEGNVVNGAQMKSSSLYLCNKVSRRLKTRLKERTELEELCAKSTRGLVRRLVDQDSTRVVNSTRGVMRRVVTRTCQPIHGLGTRLEE